MPHVPADERRRQIIEAAITVIVDEGLAHATTRRIALQAGAPLASLHYTFRDKEELFAAVYAHWVEAAADRLAELVPEGCGLEDGVRRLMTGLFEWYAAETRLAIAQYELFLWARRTPSSQDLAAGIYNDYVRVCADALQRSTGPKADRKKLTELASFVFCCFDGVMLKLLAVGEKAARKDRERLVEAALALAAASG